MATKSKYISDIELRLSKGNPSDDFQLDRRQIGFWLDNVRDELVRSVIERTGASPHSIDPHLLEMEEFTEVDEEVPSASLDEKQFVTLSSAPIHVKKDRGIVKVIGDDGVVINKSQVADLGVITDLRFSKPSSENLVYYRRGNKVYIQGMDDALISDYGITVHYVRSYVQSPVAEADEFKAGELASQILDEVEAIARRQMQQTEEDVINDGVQE